MIDICIVAGRRPELLSKTLASFAENLFAFFDIKKVYVNIDPIFGDEEHESACVRLVQSYFPLTRINRPDQAHFTRAVRSLWASTTADYVLHLEDDWLLYEALKPDVLDLLDEQTTQLSFLSKEKYWDGHSIFHRHRKRYKILGFKYIRDIGPCFSTSPSFLSGPFVRQCARLMRDAFDPEKQFYSSTNPALVAYVAPFQNRYLLGARQPILVEDIGRAWRKERRLKKRLLNGQSLWFEEGAG